MTTAITNLAEQARALYLQDRAREAVAAAEAAIRLGGSTAGLHNDLGVYRMAAGDFPGAEAALRTAIRMDPALVSAYSNLLEIRDVAVSDALLAQMQAVAARGNEFRVLRQGQPHLGRIQLDDGPFLGSRSRIVPAAAPAG